jgi:hypothetical protein
MGFTQDFLTSRRNNDDGSTRIGEHDRLWYSSSDNTIRIGDNVTPGGIIVCGGGTGDGNYVLPTASTTVKGGVKIDGTTITITNEVISGFDGNYNSLSNKPVLFSGNYTDLTNKPTLFSGSYNDLTDKPTLFSGSYNDLTNKPVLFSGNYNDLTNKPTIPPGQVNSDWNSTSGVSEILNKPTIPDITGITEVFAATSEPMGHADRTRSLISFDDASRTFTISPVNSSYDIWVKGTKWVITNSRSVTIPDTTGLYYIYFDSTGALQYKTTFFDWPNDCMTAYVYWNRLTGKAPYVADERHGITLDWQTHEYLHRTRGAAIASGFTASNFIINGDGSLNTHLQIDISDGTFFDEDLQVDIISTNTPTPNTWEQDLTGPSKIPMFYINSGGGWVMDPATNFPVKQGILPKYNLYSGGNWTTPDIDNNKFGVSFIIATNNINYPVIGIIGQSSHANQGDAEAVNFTDLSLPGFPVVELRQLYKLVFQCKTSYTNTVNARLTSVFDLRSFSSTTSAMATYTDHGSLSGLLDDDHPQYLLRTDVSALNGPAFSVYRDAVQTIPTDVLTAMTWTAEEYDTHNCVTSTRFTPTVAGYYALVATVRIDGGIGTGERMICIKKNGTEYRRGMNSKGTASVGDSWFQLDISCQVYANGTGDYFEVFVQQGAGADRNTTSGQPFTAFQGCMLRAA